MIVFDSTTNYGLTDLKNEDNLVCWKFGELIKTLVTLSSSADRQFEIMGAGIVTDEMAEDFNSYYTLSYEQFLESKLLDKTVVMDKLNYLENFIDQRSGDKAPDFWDDTTLSKNSDWQDIRLQAKEILALLGFENLDINFERTEKYEKSNSGERLLIQVTRTKLTKKQ